MLLVVAAAAADHGSIFAQAQTRCFQNSALKDDHVLRFESDAAGKVTGLYSITRNYDPGEEETYYFSGTRKGTSVAIDFSPHAAENPPTKLKRALLTLVKSGDKEILRTKFFGAGKNAIDARDFEECEPGYQALVKTARRVSFARGASQATVIAEFQNQNGRRAFLLGAGKGQTISVRAPGCAISLYYPDKTAYEEGAGIDTFGMNLPQTGDYLFLIKPAVAGDEPVTCSVTFKISN